MIHRPPLHPGGEHSNEFDSNPLASAGGFFYNRAIGADRVAFARFP